VHDRARFAASRATRAYFTHPWALGADALIVVGLILLAVLA